MGALERLASFTISIICDNKVSEPTFWAFIVNTVFPFIVPPVTLSPFILSDGMGSPEIILSSMVAVPSVIIPSTGTLSPGFTISISSTSISSSGISSSIPFFILLATGGTRFSRDLTEELVLLCALSSSTCPSKTRVRITAAASKYICTLP